MALLYGIIRTVFLTLTLYVVGCGTEVWLQYLAVCVSSLAWAVTAYMEAIQAGR